MIPFWYQIELIKRRASIQQVADNHLGKARRESYMTLRSEGV
jgi:hypothetical protein